jgi:hypothetical protein
MIISDNHYIALRDAVMPKPYGMKASDVERNVLIGIMSAIKSTQGREPPVILPVIDYTPPTSLAARST